MRVNPATIRLEITEVDDSIDTLHFEGWFVDRQVFYFSGNRLLLSDAVYYRDQDLYDITPFSSVHVLTADPATFDFDNFYREFKSISVRDLLFYYFDRSQDVELRLEQAL